MIKRSIKILIVDDSAFMRKSLQILLTGDPEIEIIGTAKDGKEGYELAKKFRPDIITLDIEMPVMDGLTALEKIMKDCPTSVIMVSSLTTEGADATLRAMELGAVDFIPKEMSFVNVNIASIKQDLIRKIKTISSQSKLNATIKRLRTLTGKKDDAGATSITASKLPPKIGYQAVALGISTGGPLSLQKVIPKISALKLKCPMFIVQHMPPKFTKSLSDRLNDLSEVNVKEAENNEIVKGGTVYIAPGGFHMVVKTGLNSQPVISISDKPDGYLHKPSVDVMMESVVDMYGKKALGIIMTGMGKDGLEGIKKLKAVGGYAIAQDESTCVVYGMPKAIVDNKLADSIIPLEKMSDAINSVM